MSGQELVEDALETPEPKLTGGRRKWNAAFAEYLGMAMVLLGLVAAFSLGTEHFLSLANLRSIANQVPAAVVVAVGMTLVIITGGIDLSAGSVLAVCGAVLGIGLVRLGLPLPAAVAVCVLVGAALGLLNGLTIVAWRLPSFIVTLGMLEIARGLAYQITGSRTVYIGRPVEKLSEGSLLGLTLPFFVALVLVVLGQFVLSRTVFGRFLIAIGTNEEAVRLSGIPTRRIKAAVFTLAGMLAGIGAVFHCARLGSADPNAGVGLELSAIAAVVIGGTSLMGGRGSVVNSFLGVLIIAVLENGLAQMGAQEPVKRLVTGCVIIAAVIVDYYRSRLRVREG